MSEFESRALAALDSDALLADAAALVQVPSVTGVERAVMERFAALAQTQADLAQTQTDLAHGHAETGDRLNALISMVERYLAGRGGGA